jgi:hypothetical protein
MHISKWWVDNLSLELLFPKRFLESCRAAQPKKNVAVVPEEVEKV